MRLWTWGIEREIEDVTQPGDTWQQNALTGRWRFFLVVLRRWQVFSTPWASGQEPRFDA